ncbi:GNAT family N-acetyltransferase [Notoacmeibacter sp. MSK16QG-6]|uniref:GNAT family N-acetyltransferase n=1 Tax=Notoacmeibacter sp. MSK16QG-6 TaxID=2957982 RepID=UPI00209C73C8|nr:GNAT family N-acetyltransferase [Notoacmeibacter sp. MSK16QG-6]MCP1199691.1 GNAT family N-acetyltransferase [Notoacmeibacter sp. MSK16QG-6]
MVRARGAGRVIEAIDIGPADWNGFTEIMGPKGGCGGCWCMLWRRTAKEMNAATSAENRALMKARFNEGVPPGLIARINGKPVGWISVDRREAFPRMNSSKILKPFDDEPVWSITCFLVAKEHRRTGLPTRMLEAAAGFVREYGGAMLEGYPIDTPKTKYPPVYAWTGFVESFRRAGFDEIERRSPTRPIMRRRLD